LLLLYPSGKSTGIVLTVLGVGIAFGVQHLGYHEFAELGRAAKRTVDQKEIIVNNLAIRRATEDISSANSLQEVCVALVAGFEHNEFDAFELMVRSSRHALFPAEFRPSFDGRYRYDWQRSGTHANATVNWQLTLALRGPLSGQEAALTVYRHDLTRNLLFDINMLTGEFQAVLSHALERVLEPAALSQQLAPPLPLADASLAAMSD